MEISAIWSSELVMPSWHSGTCLIENWFWKPFLLVRAYIRSEFDSSFVFGVGVFILLPEILYNKELLFIVA